MNRDEQWPWLGFAIEEALRLGVTSADVILGYATPEILVAQLPHEITTALLARSLASGAMSPASVLESVPPAVLAEHIESEILWRCLADAAASHQLTEKGARASEEGKRWIASILERGLSSKLIAPADVVRYIPPAEFVRDAPLTVVAEMIRAGLMKGNFDPALVLAHLTPKVIAEHLQVALAWSCIAEAVSKQLEVGDVAAAKTAEAAQPQKTEGKQPATGTTEKSALKGVVPQQRGDEKTDSHRVAVAPRKDALGGAKIEAVAPKRAAATSAPQKSDANPWTTADDLEVLDEQPLPPPPAIQKR